MMNSRFLLTVAAAALVVLPCLGADFPHTDRTKGLIDELLVKLDSTDVYAAGKERQIEALKAACPGGSGADMYDWCFQVAEEYSNYVVDSALVYLEKAVATARGMGSATLMYKADCTRAVILSGAGFNVESLEILSSIPRKGLKRKDLEHYYGAWTSLYHSLYSGTMEPDPFREKYRALYNVYRDSLLSVADTMSHAYLRNMERKEARAGNYAEARRYNAIRFSKLDDPKSKEYATCLYDRFAIAYIYEHKLTGEALDDLLESTIIEVENSNRDIATLLRVEVLLISTDRVAAAKKISDYYYSSLRKFGSRKRLIDGAQQAIRINDRTLQSLRKRNREIQMGLIFISLLLAAMVFMLLSISRSRSKIAGLKDNLERSGRISKGYVGAMFQFYSSYIRRLDVFRTRIHSSLRKGNVAQALELTSPSKDSAAEERRELYHNFDTAFVDIFPDFIQTVNSCLRPEARVIPKKTEILTTELRILALIKLGIEDSTRIAEMLHCSVKTVYNLRSALKARLAVPEKEFDAIIAEL
ncbi:MAG: DUF6377 domain-containing protein [Bacteroidales bacterium]|nr:DUF6377 domain-containing protein [Bacteroidales bacterium]